MQISDRSLSLNIYEYLVLQKSRPLRAVGIITDKQFVLYTQIEHGDYATHESMLIKLDDYIYKDKIHIDSLNNYNKDNAFIFALSDQLIIELPENNNLSSSQNILINNILNQIDFFNKEEENDSKKMFVKLYGTSLTGEYYSFDTINMQEIKEFLNTQVVDSEKEKQNEIIIGETTNNITDSHIIS